MEKNYAHQNLQKASFKNMDLRYASFQDSDLRGADFSGANLTCADFTYVKTGITPLNKAMIFLAALVISLLSGYIAMLAGRTVRHMLVSNDEKIIAAGIATIVVLFVFIAYFWWKGGSIAIRNLMLPVIVVALIISLMSYFSGYGTGMGMLYLILAVILLVVMFIIGTISRVAAGTLSSTIIFLVVALAGGMFGRSTGGGIGAVIMAFSCAQISKRALSGAKGFNSLQRIASVITATFGTAFRNACLFNTNFSKSVINNADFTGADVSSANWGDSKKINCITPEMGFISKYKTT